MGTFTLQTYDGTTYGPERSAQSLGLEAATRSLKSLAAGSLSFSVINPTAATAPLFVFGDFEIFRLNGVIIFQGYCVDPVKAASDKSIATSYEFRDIWWQFERIIYQQQWPDASTTPPQLKLSPRVIVGAFPKDDGSYNYNPSDDTGQHWDTQFTETTVNDFLLYVANLGGYFNVNANSFTGVAIWPYEATSQTCAELAKSVLKWHPFCSSWFDYTQQPPLLTINQVGDGLYPMPSVTLTVGTTLLKKLSCRAKNDGQITSVTLNFVESNNGLYKVMGTQKAQIEGVPLSEFIADITLTQGQQWRNSQDRTLNNQFITGPAILYPDNVAGWLLAQLGPTVYTGQAVIQWDLANGTPPQLLGKCLNIAGGEAAWATMNAVIQTQSDDFRTGETTITFGAQSHLGLSDWIHQVRQNVTRPPKAQAQRDNPPSPPVPSASFQLTTTKPAWYQGNVPTGKGIWITPGVAIAGGRGFLATNWGEAFAFVSNTYFFMAVQLNVGGQFYATGANIMTGGTMTAFQTDEYDEDTGDRPGTFYVPIGYVTGNGQLVNFGGGDITIVEMMNNITKNDGQASQILRTLACFRGNATSS